MAEAQAGGQGTGQYDVIVVGSGPGGEVGAIRAAQLGLKVALVEKSPYLGGTCLNVGCIPTKALLESAKTWDKLQHVDDLGFKIGTPTYDWHKIMGKKDGIVEQQRKGLLFLMKKNKIDVHWGIGRITDKNTVTVTGEGGKATALKTKNILLATGSKVRELPFAPSNGRGILTSDSILFIDHVPKSMAVIGGGVVGMEFASLFGRFGCAVTVIELGAQVIPSEDEECVAEFVKSVKKQNVTIETGAKLTKIEDKGDYVLVSVEGKEARKFEKALVSVGRAPMTEDIGLDRVGLTTDRGFIKVDEHYRTKVANIYAIGDVIPTPMLAHTASAEAMHAVEIIAGHHPPVINYLNNPNAVYTYPEIASVGHFHRVGVGKMHAQPRGDFAVAQTGPDTLNLKLK